MDFACLDLINSEQWDGFGRRTDHLEDTAWVAQFLTRWDLAQTLGPDQLDADQLVELRALLRRMVEDIQRDGQPGNEDMAVFNAVLKAAPVYRQFVRQDNTYQAHLRLLLSMSLILQHNPFFQPTPGLGAVKTDQN